MLCERRGGTPPASRNYDEVMSATEREIKLGAAETFRMPSLDGLVAGVTATPSEAERLSTTYFDTGDLRLARWGMSLRHRAGQGWTVKLPTAEAGLVLVRPEITFEGNGEEPPGEAVDLVRAVVRSSTLETQTHLNTIRRRIALHDGGRQSVFDGLHGGPFAAGTGPDHHDVETMLRGDGHGSSRNGNESSSAPHLRCSDWFSQWLVCEG